MPNARKPARKAAQASLTARGPGTASACIPCNVIMTPVEARSSQSTTGCDTSSEAAAHSSGRLQCDQ
eukprot:1577239-Karenia_brevis.AAC.1